MGSVSHIIKGEEFVLLPEKVIYWPTRQAILGADLHLGKATHFRKAGIGIPQSIELENLDRLSQLILNQDITTVYLLGDLFHSHYNEQWRVFKKFLLHFSSISFILIKGNHDILDEAAYVADNLVIYEEFLEIPPFIMTHIPLEQPHDYYNICGHLHPGVQLKGKGLQSMKLPCFYFSPTTLILPAFGAFTGTARIEPDKADTIYAITSSEVIRVQ